MPARVQNVCLCVNFPLQDAGKEFAALRHTRTHTYEGKRRRWDWVKTSAYVCLQHLCEIIRTAEHDWSESVLMHVCGHGCGCGSRTGSVFKLFLHLADGFIYSVPFGWQSREKGDWLSLI